MRQKFPNIIIGFDIGDGVGARRGTDWVLTDVLNSSDIIYITTNTTVLTWFFSKDFLFSAVQAIEFL